MALISLDFKRCFAVYFTVLVFITMFLMFCCQDFEALTPNLLARTIETVEGGGIIVVLLRTMTSLKQLYTMTMVSTNVHYLPFLSLS